MLNDSDDSSIILQDKKPMKPKKEYTRQERLKMLGNFPVSYQQMQEFFDPMRLKILVMPKKEANPFGKNPDYFFVKGLDYLNLRDTDNAIRCFQKGVNDNGTHLLCRFNLGYVLFKVGHF